MKKLYLYVVEYDRAHRSYNDHFYSFVTARNQKEACQIVLDKLYGWNLNKNDRFYPFHRKAKRIERGANYSPIKRFYRNIHAD